MIYDTLIAVTSWEDRFNMGIKYFLENNSVKCVILLNFIEYKDYTKNNTDILREEFNTNGIKCSLVQLVYNDTKGNWGLIKDKINDLTGSLIIDISTMPRDIIYFSLYHAEKSEKINDLFCIYNCPEGYSKEKWLTSDPYKPYLIYNMSGIYEMGRETIIIILTGFDMKRVEQLLNYYEPERVYLGLQTGDQYENNIRNAEQYIEFFKTSLKIEHFDLDAYKEKDYGLNRIEELMKTNKNTNVIAASLGPKPSSLALFQLNKKYPEIGLIHVPVAKFNMNYSYGLNTKKIIFEQIK